MAENSWTPHNQVHQKQNRNFIKQGTKRGDGLIQTAVRLLNFVAQTKKPAFRRRFRFRIDLVHNRLKPTEHVTNALTRLLCEVLVLTPVSLEQSGLHLRCTLMVVLKARPNFVAS